MRFYPGDIVEHYGDKYTVIKADETHVTQVHAAGRDYSCVVPNEEFKLIRRGNSHLTPKERVCAKIVEMDQRFKVRKLTLAQEQLKAYKATLTEEAIQNIAHRYTVAMAMEENVIEDEWEPVMDRPVEVIATGQTYSQYRWSTVGEMPTVGF